MKILLFISLLFLSCISTVNAQWQQAAVLPTGATGPLCAYRGNLLCVGDNYLLISTDTGKTWKITDSNPNLRNVWLFTSKDSLLFASVILSNMYVSADSGKTWKPIAPSPVNFECITFSGDTLLAGGDPDSMYLSPDYGQHWRPASSGLPHPAQFSGLMYGSFANLGEQTLTFFGNSSYITYNHGRTWGLKANNCPFSFNTIVFGNDIYMAGGEYIYKSSDSTLSWSKVFSGSMDGICTDGHNILAASDITGVVFSKDSGNSWAIINNGLPNNSTAYVTSVGILGPYIFCTTSPSSSQIFRMPLAEADTFTPVKIINGIKPLPAGLPSLNIYPDPVQHSATVNFGQPLQNGSLQIFNMQGQRVQQIDQITGAKITLQPNNLPPGAYSYLLSEQGKKTAAGKFIIQ